MEPVDALHQLANGIDDGVELDPDRAVFAGRLHDDGKFEIVREIETAAIEPRKHRRVNAMEFENLFRDRLVLRVQETVRACAGEPLSDQFEIRRDCRVSGVVASERFGKVEDEIAFHARERVQALRRSVQTMQRRGVPQLDQRIAHFVFDFLLVERAGQRRLLAGAHLLVLIVPAVV